MTSPVHAAVAPAISGCHGLAGSMNGGGYAAAAETDWAIGGSICWAAPIGSPLSFSAWSCSLPDPDHLVHEEEEPELAQGPRPDAQGIAEPGCVALMHLGEEVDEVVVSGDGRFRAHPRSGCDEQPAADPLDAEDVSGVDVREAVGDGVCRFATAPRRGRWQREGCCASRRPGRARRCRSASSRRARARRSSG